MQIILLDLKIIENASRKENKLSSLRLGDMDQRSNLSIFKVQSSTAAHPAAPRGQIKFYLPTYPPT